MRPQDKNLKPPWQRGQSGNPEGFRPLSDDQKVQRKNAREMLKAASPLAVERLIQALHSSDERNAIRAALAILDKTVPTLWVQETEDNSDRPTLDQLREAMDSGRRLEDEMKEKLKAVGL